MILISSRRYWSKDVVDIYWANRWLNYKPILPLKISFRFCYQRHIFRMDDWYATPSLKVRSDLKFKACTVLRISGICCYSCENTIFHLAKLLVMISMFQRHFLHLAFHFISAQYDIIWFTYCFFVRTFIRDSFCKQNIGKDVKWSNNVLTLRRRAAYESVTLASCSL